MFNHIAAYHRERMWAHRMLNDDRNAALHSRAAFMYLCLMQRIAVWEKRGWHIPDNAYGLRLMMERDGR
jgi:hypothetical protein